MYWKINNKMRRVLAMLLAFILTFSGAFSADVSALRAYADEQQETEQVAESAADPEDEATVLPELAETAKKASPSDAEDPLEEETDAIRVAPGEITDLLGAGSDQAVFTLEPYSGSTDGFSATASITVNDCAVIKLEKIKGWGLQAYEGYSSSLDTYFRGYRLVDVLAKLGISSSDVIYLAGRDIGNTFPVQLSTSADYMDATLLAFESKVVKEGTWKKSLAVYLAPLKKTAGKDFIKTAEDVRVIVEDPGDTVIDSPDFESRKIIFQKGTEKKEIWESKIATLGGKAYEVYSSKTTVGKFGVPDSYRGYRLKEVLELLGYSDYKSVKVSYGDKEESIVLAYDEFTSEKTVIAYQMREAETSDKAQEPVTGNSPYLAVCASEDETRYVGGVTKIEVLDTSADVTLLSDLSGFNKTAEFSVNDCTWLNAAKLKSLKLTAYEAAAGGEVYYRGYKVKDVLEALDINPANVTKIFGRTGSGEIEDFTSELESDKTILAFEIRRQKNCSNTEAVCLAVCGAAKYYSKITDLRVVYSHASMDRIQKPRFDASLSFNVVGTGGTDRLNAAALTGLQAYEAQIGSDSYRGYRLNDVLSYCGYAITSGLTVSSNAGNTSVSREEALREKMLVAFQIRRESSAQPGQAPETGSAIYLVDCSSGGTVLLSGVASVQVAGNKNLKTITDTGNFRGDKYITLNDSICVDLEKIKTWNLTAFEATSSRGDGRSYRGYKLKDVLNAAGIELSGVTEINGRTTDYKEDGSGNEQPVSGTFPRGLTSEEWYSDSTLLVYEIRENGTVKAADASTGLMLAVCMEDTSGLYIEKVRDLYVAETGRESFVIDEKLFGKDAAFLGTKSIIFNGATLYASGLKELTAYEVKAAIDGNTYRGYKLTDVLAFYGYSNAAGAEYTYETDTKSTGKGSLSKEYLKNENVYLAFQRRNVSGNVLKPGNREACYLVCVNSTDAGTYVKKLNSLTLPVRNDVIFTLNGVSSLSEVQISLVNGFGDSYAQQPMEVKFNAISGNSFSYDLPKQGNYTVIIRRNGYRTVSVPFGFYNGSVQTYLRFPVNGSTLEYDMQYDTAHFKNKNFTVNFAQLKTDSSAGAWDGKTLDVSWYKEYERGTDTPTFIIDTPAKLAGLAAIVNGLYSSEITAILDNGTSYTPIQYNQLSTRKIRPYNSTRADADIDAGVNWYGVMSNGSAPSDFAGATVKITADLNMGATYMPIGGTYGVNYSVDSNYYDFSAVIDSGFAGKLDGCGHTVNYNFERLKNGTQGFFMFQGLGLVGLLGNDDDGIAATIVDPTVCNVIVTGSLTSCRSIGGVVGRMGSSAKDISDTGTGAIVENVVNLVKVTGTDKKGSSGIVGGGYNKGIIRNAANLAAITNNGGSDFQANGIVGYNCMTVSSVYNVGKITNELCTDYARAIGSDDTKTDIDHAFWLTGTAEQALYDLGGTKDVTEVANLADMKTESFRADLEADGGDWILLSESNAGKLITANSALKNACMGLPVPSSFFEGNVVAFYMDGLGDPVATRLVDTGASVTRPVSPISSYGTFQGWYADKACTAAFDFSKPVTGKTVVYAKWSKNKYSVTLSTNGGTIGDGEVTSYVYGTWTRLPQKVTLTGYSFKGWYDNASFTGKAVTAITRKDAGSKRYYAKLVSNTDGSTAGGSSSGGSSSGGSSSGGGGSSSGGSSSGGSSSGGGGGGGGGSLKTSAGTTATFCDKWFTDSNGVWKIKNKAGQLVTSAWLCDNYITANGQNVWYLMNTDGAMLAAGLVQDNTGNFYSLETTHNGYYGSLRYKNGTYDCNGQQVYLEFSQKHDGTFGAVTNAEGLEKLKAIYGVTKFGIDNNSCTYTDSFYK